MSMRGRVDNSLFHANLLDAPDHDCDFAGRVAGSERMAVRGGERGAKGRGIPNISRRGYIKPFARNVLVRELP
jgi:hypothetical protein